MPELSTASVPGQAPVTAQVGLTPPEIDALLAGFRDWLMRTVAVTDAAVAPTLARAALPDEPPDLHSLLSQLIALKQEVNLQTRASRSQQEQGAETLRHLADALQALEQDRAFQDKDDSVAAERERSEQLERLRPLLKAMVDAHDALSLAQSEVRRIHESLTQAPGADVDHEPPVPAASTQPHMSWLARWLGLSDAVSKSQQDATLLAQEREARMLQKWSEERTAIRKVMDSIVTGYTMSLQRLERALAQHGLAPISCVGEAFDPDSMEVVEVVHRPGRSVSEVVEEVRRGYLWQGRLFRFAQVKVARPAKE